MQKTCAGAAASVHDLRRIVANSGDEFTAAAREAAKCELASRIAAGTDVDPEPVSDARSGDHRPPGVITLMWASVAVAAFVVAGLSVVGVLSLLGRFPVAEVLGRNYPVLLVGIVAAWIAVAIRTEWPHLRLLVIAASTGWLVLQGLHILVTPNVSMESIGALGLAAGMLWYFARSNDVTQYDRVLRSRA